MGVKINMSGTKISGNAKVLNGLTVSGKSNAEINIKRSSMSGQSQTLNDMNISGNSSVNIGINDTNIKDRARVLNDMEVENGKVDVSIENLQLDKDTEFMNSRQVKDNTVVTSAQDAHRKFEARLSEGGRLKGSDTTEAIRNAQNSSRNTRSSDRDGR